MRLAFGFLAFLASATPIAAAEMLTGPQIEPALNGVTIWYEPLSARSARQFFNKNGETPYVDAKGSKTYGQWSVRGDKYCSLWPPSDHWTCFEVERETRADGNVFITFASGGGGKRYVGIAKPGMHVDEAWGG
ncbi:MAG: hypothetical protein WCC66_11505 [Rhizobiaceae bacterium]